MEKKNRALKEMSVGNRQNDLFKYFSRKPKDEPDAVMVDDVESESITAPKAKSFVKASDIKLTPAPKPKKKHALVSEDIDAVEDELMSPKKSVPSSKRRRVIYSSDESEEVEDQTPIKKGLAVTPNTPSTASRTPSRPGPSTKGTPSTKKGVPTRGIGAFADSFISSFSFDDSLATESDVTMSPSNSKALVKTIKDGPTAGDLPQRFPHLDFAFLKPENIRDAEKRRPEHPDYDPRTLFVPEDFRKKQTPGHRQWWELKAQHFDTILFFKIGKFYELYHMDAVIAVECLNLVYMAGHCAHCGFPEISYGRYSDQLVNRGYKVARVEQTETPQEKDERCRKTNVKEKVVRRELCRVTTPATKTYGILDGTDSRELDGAADSAANWLMALTERFDGDVPSYGICFIDCSVGAFYLSQFTDDASRSQLRTLLAHNCPTQLLYQKGALSPGTMTLLNASLANVRKEALSPKRQFLTAEAALSTLSEEVYLGPLTSEWPEVLRKTLSDSTGALPSPDSGHKLSLSALGAVLWYLKGCLIDVDMVTMRNFYEYLPPSSLKDAELNKPISPQFWDGKRMVLDGTALLNLHILPAASLTPGYSQRRGGAEASSGGMAANFSLFTTICHCRTAFGKRLLRQWLSAPECDPSVLIQRQGAVKWLSGDGANDFVDRATEILRKVPDLERLFQRIHTIGLKYRAEQHPDSRAQLFEMGKYNKRKIRDLLLALDGLEEVQKLTNAYAKQKTTESDSPTLMEKCLGSKFPEMSSDLAHFKNAFDREHCLEEGVIVPRRGVDAEFDAALEGIATCERQLKDYLEEQRRKLKCPFIVYLISTVPKNRYLLEVPDSVAKSVPDNFSAGFQRYSTPVQLQLVDKLTKAESYRDGISAEATRRVFADFDQRKSKWAKVVENVAVFDCLLSLVLYARTCPERTCLPEFIFDSQKPFLEIRRGFHPSLIASTKSKAASNADQFSYIPNDCQLGGGTSSETPSTILLTGPNMGGKSTYMRQVSSLVVLAQIGSFVPAESMRLTPVDRVFCRIGASDRLFAGQSTFYVELSETNIILRQATANSLVLIDELGRGTGTHDGTAIACAVLKHISRDIRCRTLFSTHYHELCKFIADDPGIAFAHMACMVENANVEDPSMENITFLYTLAEGLCDKSYGFYTAKMAGISVEVVRRAFAAAQLLTDQAK